MKLRPVPILALLAALALGACGCARFHPQNETRFEFTQPQMGLPFRLVFYARDQAAAEAAAQSAFARIRQLNDRLSDYDPDSELSRLSRTSDDGGGPVNVSADLWRVLARAQRLAAQTDGAFDVTVGPLVHLWRKARREKKIPRADALAAARAAVGWRHLQLDPRRRTARLLRPRMRLDLGAIAKGCAVDEALAVLGAHGVTRALVAGGGDLAAGEAPPGTRGWRVEVAPLDAPDAPPARVVLLRRAALATSGDLFQRVELDGKRYSHILDPRTGAGLTDHGLVTVIARDGLTADSLATAVSVLGPGPGLQLIERTPGAAARVVRQPGERIEAMESRRFSQWEEPPPARP